MTKRKDYVIDTSKIKTLKDVKNIFECLGIICDMSILEESDPRYELAKEYFVIPYVEEPKGIEYYQKEFDKKFEKIIEQYKRNSYASKLTAEREYEDKFDKISYNFQCAVNNGFFPQYLSLTTSGNATIGNGIVPNSYLDVSGSLNNTITHNIVINSNVNNVGYWESKPIFKVYFNKRPNWLSRICAKIIFDITWKSV